MDPRSRIEPSPRSERKRNQILDAAAAVIAERGYAHALLNEIAARAKTQAGSLYYHFDSREELIEEVLRKGVRMNFSHAQDVLASLPRSSTPRQRLEAIIRAHLIMTLVESNYARATARLIGQVSREMAERIKIEYVKYDTFLDRLIKAAMKSGELDPEIDPSAYRLLIFSAANWAPEWFRPNGRLSAEQVADLFVRIVIDGVSRPKRGK